MVGRNWLRSLRDIGIAKEWCLFRITKITPTLEEISDCIDKVGTGIERRARKQEDIFIPNKPSVKNIVDWFGLGKDFAYWYL